MKKNSNDGQTEESDISDSEPTGEWSALETETAADSLITTGPDVNVVDPNVLTLRRVDAEIRRLMTSWVDLEKQLSDRDAEIRRLRNWGGSVEEAVKATRQELATGQERIAELLRALGVKDADRIRLESQLAEYRDALAGMAAQLDTYESTSASHDDEKAQLAAHIIDMNQQLAELNTRAQKAETVTLESGKQLTLASRRAKSLENDLRQASRASSDLEQKLEAKATVIRALEAAVQEHEKQCSGLRAEAVQTKKALELALREAGVESATRHRELQRELDAERNTSLALRAHISELSAEQSRLVAKLDEQMAEIAAVDSDFQAKRRALAALGSEFDRIGSIQANVRKLDSMMNRQLSGIPDPVAGDVAKPRHDRLIVSLDGDKAEKYPLLKTDMVIGRSCNTDIRVAGPHTSRRHARVYIENGIVMVQDLGSLNGITVNGKNVRTQELHDGDVLGVGGARLRFVDLEEKAVI